MDDLIVAYARAIGLRSAPWGRAAHTADGGLPEASAHYRAAVERLEYLGRSGLTVSVCCGPSGRSPFRWTVHVLSRDGQEFDRPFAANDFAHAVEIAELEATKRGWLS